MARSLVRDLVRALPVYLTPPRPEAPCPTATTHLWASLVRLVYGTLRLRVPWMPMLVANSA